MRILDHLLAPIGAERFFRENWAKSPVVVRGDPHRFADLFSWQGLDDYLNYRLRFFVFPAIQLYFGAAMGGARVPAEFFTESIRDANRLPLTVVSPRKVRELCREGATLLVHSVHDGDARLKRFAAGLEHELGEALRVDLFYTPAASSGVHAHFDREDVFVLQIEGEKEWHVSNPTVPFPLRMPDLAEIQDAPKMPDAVYRLARGDLLHIPRGYWHATQTSSSPSLHLSVRVACRTGVDLLRWAVDQLESGNPGVRENLPLTLQQGHPYGYDPASATPAVRAVRDALVSLLDGPDFLARFNRACVRDDRAAAPYRFASQEGAPGAEPSWYSRPATQRVELVEGGEHVTFVAWGRELTFTRRALSVLRAIVAAHRFTAADLGRLCPDVPTGDVDSILCRLVAEGLLFEEGVPDAGGTESVLAREGAGR
jgi:ribosomal protein L16 Arg81 hydroxylase